ncbi:MAG TPA: DUF1559 domain-containing protein [Pirellulales bacterium]|nr:DUF1559 domain-containing protein [Pirellulales bacterium]
MPTSGQEQSGTSTTARFKFTLRGLLLFMLLCSVACAVLFRVLLPGLRAAREAARQSQCGGHLKQIGLALQSYHDVYGCFPAPFVADRNGKPMHSWRVAILPYVDSSTFYSSYDFNKPWNSPGNTALARKWCSRGNIYSCPSDDPPWSAGFTNYVMIVGPTAVSRAGQWRSLGQITNSPGQTIIIAEIADSDIFWSEPRDLTLDEMSLQINDKSKTSISSHHPHGAKVVLADGSVKFLDESTTPEQLRVMLTSDADD